MFSFVAFCLFFQYFKNVVFVYTDTDNCNPYNCVWPLIILIWIILCIMHPVTVSYFKTFVFCTSLFTLVYLICFFILELCLFSDCR
jgi:hypothetical protein